MNEKHMIFIFPSCINYWYSIDKIMNESFTVSKTKELKLKNKDKFNLIMNLYIGENWIGNIDNNYKGLFYKLNSCFPNNFDTIKIYCVTTSTNKLLKIKKQIRELCNVENHSIHTTDTIKEYIRMEKLLF